MDEWLAVIEIQHLTKHYGNVVALDRLSLSIPAGIVLGMIGPRGSGKTTLLRVLATLVEPTDGDAFINGASVKSDPLQVRRAVGFLPDDGGVYTDLTCAEYVAFFAACYGVPANQHATLVDDLLQLVDLHHRKDWGADRLTRGMRQRLGIARVLVHDPQVLLFDELFTPMDPRARVETRELVRELCGMGKTILITGVSLAELQDVCTHVATIAAGRINKLGTLEEMAVVIPPYRHLLIKFLGDADLATRLLRAGHGVVDVRPVDEGPVPANTLPGIAVLKELEVTFNGAYADASALLRSLMHSGVQIVGFAEET